MDAKIGRTEVPTIVDTADMITLADESLFPYLHANCEVVQLTGIGSQPVAGRIVRAVPVTVGENTTKWDVCVTRIDDKLNLGLDFLDACKAMIDLPHRTVTINGEQIRAPSVEGTDIQVSRAVLTKGVALPPNSITSLAVKINPNTKSQLLVRISLFIVANFDIQGGWEW